MATQNRSPLNLEALLAFNDELAGVVRAGLPLDLGLRQIADSTLGGISRLSQRLQERVAAGVSLEQALSQEGDHLPNVYIAIVHAGLKVGRLPQALEMLSVLGRTMLELHRRSLVALIYPLIVLTLAYGCFLAFIAFWIPQIVEQFYSSLRAEPGPIFLFLRKLSDTVIIWSWAAPLFVWLMSLIFSFVFSTNDGQIASGSLLPNSVRRFAWLPWMRSAMDNLDRAMFSKLLSVLINHETPLHEAVVLASCATGNPALMRGSNRLAELLRGGQSLAICVQNIDTLPPFMRSMMAIGERHQALGPTMWQTSDVYQRRADQQVEFARSVLPILLSCGIGGVALLVYSLTVFAPVWELNHQVAQPLRVM